MSLTILAGPFRFIFALAALVFVILGFTSGFTTTRIVCAIVFLVLAIACQAYYGAKSIEFDRNR